MPLQTQGPLLGYAGLLPFIALALATSIDFSLPLKPHYLLITYGAVILSFMGAIHWGVAISSKSELGQLQLGLSVLPALLAWAALMLPLVYGYSLLILSFISLCIFDKYVNKHDMLPSWYLPMRIILTTGVVLCLIVAATVAVI